MKTLIAHLVQSSLWHAPRWLAERLHADFPEHQFVHVGSYGELPPVLPDTDVFFGMSLRPEQFVLAKQLKWVHSPAAAVHQLLYPELMNSDVIVTNATSVHGPVVAEHAVAQVLALAKALHIAVRHQVGRKWAQDEMWMDDMRRRPREIAEATLLVVGLGEIGSKIAEHARALRMHVIATREHPERGAGPAHEVHASSELATLLPRADFVVLAAPVTGETQALLDRDALAVMKETAYVVNVGRGALVDEAALVHALRDRKIAGAALDVFLKEPLPPESPLWEFDSVLITPHTAGFTERVWERHYRLFRDNFSRFINGENLLGVVDKHRGY